MITTTETTRPQTTKRPTATGCGHAAPGVVCCDCGDGSVPLTPGNVPGHGGDLLALVMSLRG